MLLYVQQGQLDLVPVVLAGLLGTVLGALPWYGRSLDQRGTDRSLVQRHVAGLASVPMSCTTAAGLTAMEPPWCSGALSAWHSHADLGPSRR